MQRGECIEWPGPRTTKGYGKRRYNGKTTTAHRVAWQEAHGQIPDGMFVLHRCDNRPCCNVEHLFLGAKRKFCDPKCRRRARTASERLVRHCMREAEKAGILVRVYEAVTT